MHANIFVSVVGCRCFPHSDAKRDDFDTKIIESIKATPHAAHPMNETNTKECLAEREGPRCQHGAKKVSKTIKLEPKGEPERAKEPSKTPLRNRAAKSIQKGCQVNSTKRLLWILLPQFSKCYVLSKQDLQFPKVILS